MTDQELTNELRAKNLRAVELTKEINVQLARIKAILDSVKELNQKLQRERNMTQSYRKELNG